MDNSISKRRKACGFSTVEFAVVGTAMLMMLFGVIEVSRAFFVWESLTEVTRRGARVAAVCPMNHSAITTVAVMSTPGNGANSPVIAGLTSGDVVVSYLDASGAVTANFIDVRYVRVAIAANYQHQFILPFFNQLISAPPLETTLPRESLGVVPNVGTQCFGTVI